MKNLVPSHLKRKKGKPGRKKKEKLPLAEPTVVGSDIKTDSSEPIQETPEVSTSAPIATEIPAIIEESIEPKKRGSRKES